MPSHMAPLSVARSPSIVNHLTQWIVNNQPSLLVQPVTYIDVFIVHEISLVIETAYGFECATAENDKHPGYPIHCDRTKLVGIIGASATKYCTSCQP